MAPKPSLEQPVSAEGVFAPVRSQTAFSETVERLARAIELGLLPPGTRLPPERELCARLGVARSTLRHSLAALGRSGHLRAVRGRGGGTFVTDPQPLRAPVPPALLADWREVCDQRMAVEPGVVLLAAARAPRALLDRLDELVQATDSMLDDFDSYRQADVRLHVGLAEATGSARLVAMMTEAQGAMTGLISFIVHPPEVLVASTSEHRRLLAAVRAGDEQAAVRELVAHLRATERVLARLLPPLEQPG